MRPVLVKCLATRWGHQYSCLSPLVFGDDYAWEPRPQVSQPTRVRGEMITVADKAAKEAMRLKERISQLEHNALRIPNILKLIERVTRELVLADAEMEIMDELLDRIGAMDISDILGERNPTARILEGPGGESAIREINKRLGAVCEDLRALAAAKLRVPSEIIQAGAEPTLSALSHF